MKTDEYLAYIEATREYNRKLSKKGIVWEHGNKDLTEYENILNITNSGNMG